MRKPTKKSTRAPLPVDAAAWADRQIEYALARARLFVQEDVMSVDGTTMVATAAHMNGIMRDLLARLDSNDVERR